MLGIPNAVGGAAYGFGVIREVTDGDLLQSRAEALVNPVNTQGVMGAGLADQFRKKYPAMFREYRTICERRMLDVGSMHFWPTGEDQPRFIVNFPTKRSWREPSKLAWVRDGLDELQMQIWMRQIDSVAIPALGCGLGGLSWSTVRAEILAAFRRRPGIDVLIYPPLTQPPVKAARERRVSP